MQVVNSSKTIRFRTMIEDTPHVHNIMINYTIDNVKRLIAQIYNYPVNTPLDLYYNGKTLDDNILVGSISGDPVLIAFFLDKKPNNYISNQTGNYTSPPPQHSEEEINQKINQLVEMGAQRDIAANYLAQVNYDMNSAIPYLFSGNRQITQYT